MKRFNRIFTVIIFIFLYIPMIVLAVASFNKGTDVAVFKGFTFSQYAELFRDGTLLTLLRNSLFIAVLSSLVATVLGTVAALGIHKMRGKMRSAVMTLTNIPMTNPEIVTGVSLALLFAFAGSLLRIKSILGFWTLLIAHITFNLPYIILNVMPKLSQMDPDLTEAALDLGCTPVQAFFKVVLHEIMPGIVSGALMAFTMSLDDFVVSYFAGNGLHNNLSMYIYSAVGKAKGVNPAISTIIFIPVVTLLLIVNIRSLRKEREDEIQNKKVKLKKGNEA